MSKRENTWYLIETILERVGGGLRPRWSVFLVWLALIVIFVAAYQTGALTSPTGEHALEQLSRLSGSPLFFPAVFLVVLAFAAGLGVLLYFVRRRRAYASYWKGLASPTPDELIRWIDRSLGQQYRLPDLDALLAQSKAFAYAYYGDEARALAALRTVRWNEKAPLIQAIGLGAECVIELLCRNDTARALELARKAQGMASLSSAIPGSGRNRSYYATCVAVCEALSTGGTPETLRALEENAGANRPPGLQLLATFGLAAAFERAGNPTRAAELRASLRARAPHCAPLHRAHADRLAPAGAKGDNPVSASLPSSGGPTEQSVKRKVIRLAAMKVGLWLALIAMYLAWYAYFSRH